MNITYFTNTALLVAPSLLIIAGLVPSRVSNKNPKTFSRVYGAIAWAAFASSLLAALAFMFDRAHSVTFISWALPGNIGSFSIGTLVNAVTLVMLVLVSFVGAIVTRYARNYLDGDADQGRFHKWLSLTLAAILTLIVSGNLLMFSLAWISTSLCLHQLLMFYKTRPAAVLAAHKKFIASRIGDVSLVAAILLIGSTLHTLEFEEVFRLMATMTGPVPIALQWASFFIIISAALKSAQFPFHGWLIQVMEAPTPVSALLHAGIVNAGAFLVIRMSPVVSQSPGALGTLVLIGLVTLTLASLVMLTQTSIKASLAWSTTAQMGFMLLECGLGLYGLAMLHLVAHSLYKAHAFLSSGSGVDAFRAPTLPAAANTSSGTRALAVIFAISFTVVIGIAFGIEVNHEPALLAAVSIVAIAMTQLLLQASRVRSGRVFVLRAMGLTALVGAAYFLLHHLFEIVLKGSVMPVRVTDSAFQWILAAVIVAIFVVLLWLQEALKSGRSSLRESVYVHLYNGLYIDVFITRMLQRVWPAPLSNAHQNGG